MASLIFSRSNNLITLIDKDGKTRGFWPAANNVTNPKAGPYAINKHGPAPNGTWDVGDPIRVPADDPTHISYGDWKFPVGRDDDIAGRRLIRIHGGRTSYLDKTNGCIRMNDSDIAKLAQWNNDHPGDKIRSVRIADAALVYSDIDSPKKDRIMVKAPQVEAPPVKAPRIKAPRIEAPRFCEHCGASVDNDSTFCEKCGKSVAPRQPKSETPAPVRPTGRPPEISKKSGRKPALIILGSILGFAFLVSIIAINVWKINPARDLTGTWTGSGVFYENNLSGERALKVTTDIVFHLNQSGNDVTGDYEINPVSVERLSENYAPVFAGMGQSLKGTVSSTTVILDAGGIVYGGRGPIEEWTFTFTTDLMSGGGEEYGHS
ncbi:MAG: hypothetical protein A2Z75_02230 [Chloroflexi bacterium RBG_13_50_10]|nr:MAG: hypothetical protein A2Z75_02230 [Chloroflexi bacterium RBG_13_50_10]